MFVLYNGISFDERMLWKKKVLAQSIVRHDKINYVTFNSFDVDEGHMSHEGRLFFKMYKLTN